MGILYRGMFYLIFRCFGMLFLFVDFGWLISFLGWLLAELSFLCFEYFVAPSTDINTSLKTADPSLTVSIHLTNIITGGCLATTGGDKGEGLDGGTGALKHPNILTRNNLVKYNLLERRNCFAWEIFRFGEGVFPSTADFKEAGCSIDTGLEQKKIFNMLNSGLLTMSSPLCALSCLVS